MTQSSVMILLGGGLLIAGGLFPLVRRGYTGSLKETARDLAASLLGLIIMAGQIPMVSKVVQNFEPFILFLEIALVLAVVVFSVAWTNNKRTVSPPDDGWPPAPKI